LPVVSENLPDHNYIEQNSSVNSKSAEELKRENAMLTEKIQTLFEENNKLKSSNYKTNVVKYVSGFVVKQILRKLNCNLCVSFIKINQPESIKLTKTIDFGIFSYISKPICVKYN